jgi:uncharacterized protein YdaU (DUF1376 family)
MSDAQIPQRRSNLAYVAAVVGALLIVAFLVLAMMRYVQPAPLDQARAAERAKALKDLRAAEAQALATTAWSDKTKGIIRLRVEDAVALVEREWAKSPAGMRSNLNARVEKATAPPPKAPEKPSEFE